MKASMLPLGLFLVFTSSRAEALPFDADSWNVTGRVTQIDNYTFPGGGTQTTATLASVIAGGTTVYATFICTATADCRTLILGSCTKQTLTTTQTGPGGTTTDVQTSCVNPHYADCWTFTGHLTPQLWGDSQVAAYGCNF